jgi:hypothetical protein
MTLTPQNRNASSNGISARDTPKVGAVFLALVFFITGATLYASLSVGNSVKGWSLVLPALAGVFLLLSIVVFLQLRRGDGRVLLHA